MIMIKFNVFEGIFDVLRNVSNWKKNDKYLNLEGNVEKTDEKKLNKKDEIDKRKSLYYDEFMKLN